MSSMPMYFPPDPFNLQEAVMCSRLMYTAYDMYDQWINQGKPDAHKFEWTPKELPKGHTKWPTMDYGEPIFGTDKVWFLKHKEPFCFVSSTDDGKVYLVFRGTESTEDWIEDVEIKQKDYDLAAGYGKVHEGFLKIYKTMNAAVIDALGEVKNTRSLYITGHSLGSGLSTLAVPDVITHTDYTKDNVPVLQYNLASPCVGNPEFASAYNGNQVPTYRIVNTCDIVPQMPPAVTVMGDLIYEHVGTPIDFTAQYGSLAGNHHSTSSYHYALTHPNQPQDPNPPQGKT